MLYIFKTEVTMKPYNHAKWWIDSDIINEIRIEAENVTKALKIYQKIIDDKHCISISDNALKNKQAMYINIDGGELQTGYVITAKTDFRDNERQTWTTQYIDLWIEILTIVNTEF